MANQRPGMPRWMTWILRGILVVGMACALVPSRPAGVHAQGPAQNAAMRLVRSTPESLVLEFHLPEVTLEQVPGPDGEYVRVRARGLEPGAVPGAPQLPQAGTLIGLPPAGQATVQVLEAEEERVPLSLPVYPAPVPVPPELDSEHRGRGLLPGDVGAGGLELEFAPDPDIAIRQKLADGSYRNRIAVEIKGGRDVSNIHNRLGEAEKSHQKARGEGFTQFWTVVNVANVDPMVWRQETPTTNELFYLGEIADVRSPEYARFREYLVSELGI